jgi:hypothetical protein
MPRRLFALTLAALIALPALPAAANEKATAVIGQAIDGFIRPGYAQYERATGALVAAGRALCATPSQSTLDAARESFGATVDAWSAVEIVRFGPVSEQNRLERTLFWPDRKGTGLKQVQSALADQDASATTAESLARKSVAMQGLGALEFVLFGAGAEALATPDAAYRCAYGAAIAGNLDTIAGELVTAWAAPDGFAAHWANPGPGNPLYRDGTEAVTDLLGVFIEGLELVRDVRINGFLSRQAAADKPRQALFWRSGKTVDAIAHNLAGMRALFEASHLADTLSAKEAWLADSALAQFNNAAAAAVAIDEPVETVLATPENRQKLEHLRLITSSLSDLFGTRISGDLGITAGFSSLDGD